MRISDWSSDVCSSDLLKEITRFRWYFRPDTEKQPDREVDPVAEEKFFERLREDRLKDLQSTRDKLKAIRPRCDKVHRSEEHTSELQSLIRNSYAVFCLKTTPKHHRTHLTTL